MTLRTQAIEYPHNGATLEGLLAWDDASEGQQPGVLVSHAWAGRSEFEDAKAQELARFGYVGFALDLYGKGVRGSSNEENAGLMQPFMENRSLLQARLNASLDAMLACEVVDATRSAIIGYCFGGLCALDLARSGRDLRAAISLHGLLTAPGNTSSIKAKVLALHGWDDPMAPPADVRNLPGK